MLLQFIRSSSAGLGASVELQRTSERFLLEKFPEIERVFALSRDDPGRDDPWWTYHKVQARDADALLEALRSPFVTAAPR